MSDLPILNYEELGFASQVTMLLDRPLSSQECSALKNILNTANIGLQRPDLVWENMEDVHKKILMSVLSCAAYRELKLRES